MDAAGRGGRPRKPRGRNLPHWLGPASKAFPRPQPRRKSYPKWPAWDDLVQVPLSATRHDMSRCHSVTCSACTCVHIQKLYVLDWEDEAEWYVPPVVINRRALPGWDLEREEKLFWVKEQRKSLKSLVRYNLVQGRIARAIPGLWASISCGPWDCH